MLDDGLMRLADTIVLECSSYLLDRRTVMAMLVEISDLRADVDALRALLVPEPTNDAGTVDIIRDFEKGRR